MSKEFNPEDFDNVLKFFSKVNKEVYGIEFPKIDEPTIQELTIGEMIGREVKIKK